MSEETTPWEQLRDESLAAMTEAERAEYDAAAVAERERRVDEAIHSVEMAGLHVSAAGLADAAEYVAGRIDSDELVARTRARYGLD